MRPLPLSRIRITDTFWSRWQRIVVESSLPAQLEQLESTRRLANFRIASGKEQGEHVGIYFNDSDVYKWLEACAYGLAVHSNEKLKSQVDTVIETVIAAQEPSGYLDTFFQIKHPDLKFKNLVAMHEMYCMGHMIEAGVALFECLGDRRMLDASIRVADHLLSIFGEGKRRGYCGHEEIELALVKLANTTGQERYRELARFMVEERGKRPTVFEQELDDPVALSLSPWSKNMMTKHGEYSGEYCQDHAPVREHTQVVGHAVRGMYLYTAVADLIDGKGDVDMETALERMWENLTQRRMYITGGIGPSASNEGFTADYDLPNLTAYAETCAACGLIFWGQKMLEMTGNGEYGDVLERALYNGAISGISLDGTRYFYDNPLESRGTHARVPWFHCACCPPNIARLIGNLASFVASEADADFYIHQYSGFEAQTTLNGVPVTIRAESQFPWNGTYRLSIEPERPVQFALRFRLPDWSEDISAEVPGAEEEAEYDSGYAVFDRVWKPGDTLVIDLGIEPRWIESNVAVRDDLGRIALTRGPLVYCAESVDAAFDPQLFVADPNADVTEQWEPDLEGMISVTVSGVKEIEQPDEPLYVPFGTAEMQEVQAKFIPYYAWANRGASAMAVWVRY